MGLQITGGETRCNEPLYNEDPVLLVTRFHIYTPIWLSITTHSIILSPLIPRKKQDAYRNNLLFIWATSLWEGGQVADLHWIIIMRQSTIYKKNCHVQVTEKLCHIPSILKCRDMEDSHTLSKLLIWLCIWRARWKEGVSDDLRLKSKLLLFSWTLAHRLVFVWRTLLRTYFLTWDLKFEELAYYFCLKLTQRKQQDRGF